MQQVAIKVPEVTFRGRAIYLSILHPERDDLREAEHDAQIFAAKVKKRPEPREVLLEVQDAGTN